MKEIITRNYQSPLGVLMLGDFEGRLCLCDWKYRAKRDIIDKRILEGLNAVYKEGDSELLNSTIIQLEEYFNLERKKFTLPVLTLGTEFQKRVWSALQKIKYGTTASYSDLTKQLGDLKAIRAVSSANGSNAISIIIPCHRIIGSNGALTGYAGGLQAKKRLLKIEGSIPDHGQLDLFGE
jgi:methylated-DNA-[protein]-cysteine S-methyltransferase